MIAGVLDPVIGIADLLYVCQATVFSSECFDG